MGAAAAMAVLIGLISAAATVLFAWLGWFVEKRTQAWRGR
jgi:iron(III) transport system permease protein